MSRVKNRALLHFVWTTQDRMPSIKPEIASSVHRRIPTRRSITETPPSGLTQNPRRRMQPPHNNLCPLQRVFGCEILHAKRRIWGARRASCSRLQRRALARRKPLARKSLARKPLARKSLARKPLARKPLARKPLARKPLARTRSGVWMRGGDSTHRSRCLPTTNFPALF